MTADEVRGRGSIARLAARAFVPGASADVTAMEVVRAAVVARFFDPGDVAAAPGTTVLELVGGLDERIGVVRSADHESVAELIDHLCERLQRFVGTAPASRAPWTEGHALFVAWRGHRVALLETAFDRLVTDEAPRSATQRGSLAVAFPRVPLEAWTSCNVGDVLVLDRERAGRYLLLDGTDEAFELEARDGALHVKRSLIVNDESVDGDELIPVARVPVVAVIEVARVELTAGEAASLVPGSLVVTDEPDGSRVRIRVGGKVVAEGRLVTVEGKAAVEITRVG